MKYPHSETRLAKFISKRIDELKGTKAQVEIATQAGFTNPNFLSMLKAGSSKLPIDRVPDMARALDADPAYLLRLTLDCHDHLTRVIARQFSVAHLEESGKIFGPQSLYLERHLSSSLIAMKLTAPGIVAPTRILLFRRRPSAVGSLRRLDYPGFPQPSDKITSCSHSHIASLKMTI